MKKNITKILSIIMLSALVVTGCSTTPTVTTGAATTTAGTMATTTAAATTITMPTATTAATTTTPAVTTTAATTATKPATTTAAGTTAGKLELTLAELAKFDGKNGQPAYVAVDGVIYDVSNESEWKGGKHEGYSAGKDLTADMKASPHGMGVLKSVPIVGTIKK